MQERIEDVLQFWFGEGPDGEERPSGPALWFGRSARVDREIERKFGRILADARAGRLDAWAATPRGRLALIVVLDQFSRNVFRDTPEAFTADDKALGLCLDGLDEQVDRELSPLERAFFYMPAMHSEDPDIQLTSVEMFAELAASAPPEHEAACASFLRHAERHREVVERFERFPHRNAILGRTSTPEEATYLQQTEDL